MTNLWTFLLQTLTVSLAATLLLLLKYLLQAHLSPRWQYGVWGLFALRLLLPVAVSGRFILLPFPLWVETCKSLAESHLTSAFTAAFAPLHLPHSFPYLTGIPTSVTDWLFILYVVGVAAFLIRYLVRYYRLRTHLQQGAPLSAATQAQLDRVCAQYRLKSCPAVTVPGLSTACLCGVFRPILALPAEHPTDDKVLLHELLHLRHHDAAQGALWAFFRALHWCNPFLQYVFWRIGRDIEALCDHRVLERLTEEERRDYNEILPSMKNEKSPHIPGTASLGNDGEAITRRVAAAAHFRQYPKDMALAALCITVILATSLFWGVEPPGLTDLENRPPSPLWAEGDGVAWNFHRGFAMSRLYRATTPAGAVDAYAKGLLQNNPYYLAAASPLDQQMYWITQTQTHPDARYPISLADPKGLLYAYSQPASLSPPFAAYSLARQEDGSYTAQLVFPREYVQGPDTQEYLRDEEDNILYSWLSLPIRITQSDGWVVEAQGTITPYFQSPDAGFSPYLPGNTRIEALCRRFTAQSEHGTVDLWMETTHEIQDPSAESWPAYRELPDLHANWTQYYISSSVAYTAPGDGQMNAPQWVGVSIAPDTGSRRDQPPEDLTGRRDEGNMNSTSEGTHYLIETLTDTGSVYSGGGGFGEGNSAGVPVPHYNGFHAQIYWNGQLQETLYLKEVPYE